MAASLSPHASDEDLNARRFDRRLARRLIRYGGIRVVSPIRDELDQQEKRDNTDSRPLDELPPRYASHVSASRFPA